MPDSQELNNLLEKRSITSLLQDLDTFETEKNNDFANFNKKLENSLQEIYAKKIKTD